MPPLPPLPPPPSGGSAVGLVDSDFKPDETVRRRWKVEFALLFLSVLRSLFRYGFAAGCEAGLCPAGGAHYESWARPLVRPVAQTSRA